MIRETHGWSLLPRICSLRMLLYNQERFVFDGLVLASSVRRSTAEFVFHFAERFHGTSWTREGQDVWMRKVSGSEFVGLFLAKNRLASVKVDSCIKVVYPWSICDTITDSIQFNLSAST